MEEKFFSKLNVYDVISYIIVGAFTLLLIDFDAFYFFQFHIISFSLDTTLIWLIIAFYVGHLVQGFANLINDISFFRFLIPEDKGSYDDKQKEILYQAKEFFGLQKQDENRLWNLCYTLVSIKDETGRVSVFNAYYGLYRGWLVLFLFESLFLMYFVIFVFKISTLILFLLSIFSSVIFYRRSKRFWKYATDEVLRAFVVIKTLNL
ncbi:hypothetical protein IT6_02815 [Methylacidiphilum caldifontis]|uniref:hypothetical protein n=1 Tax=Methylacidiphilum caldifontis TaxID=2795386 RepID=UPI001A8DEE17|nr:hypothetical protein [Methylacidiphilum caldifontis]QSR89233.1 hypothetical protein IT6_02815 [Methylacidiphilum caldifontis]